MTFMPDRVGNDAAGREIDIVVCSGRHLHMGIHIANGEGQTRSDSRRGLANSTSLQKRKRQIGNKFVLLCIRIL